MVECYDGVAVAGDLLGEDGVPEAGVAEAGGEEDCWEWWGV